MIQNRCWFLLESNAIKNFNIVKKCCRVLQKRKAANAATKNTKEFSKRKKVIETRRRDEHEGFLFSYYSSFLCPSCPRQRLRVFVFPMFFGHPAYAASPLDLQKIKESCWLDRILYRYVMYLQKAKL